MKKFALPSFWIVGVIAVVLAGFQPNPYLEKVRSIAGPHAYPINNVLTVIAMMTVFAVVTYAILRPATYTRNWGRALMCLCLALAFLAFALLASMHAPLHMTVFQGWIALAALVLLLLTIWSAVAKSR
jgi:hypothetical protein